MTAVHPNPPIRPNPLRAALDTRFTAGDDHCNIPGILAGDLILSASIPYGIPGRELALALDFRGSAAIEIETPMRNVTVMTDPIEQLASANIIIPTPVHVNATFDVRLHLCGANPGLVIQL